MKKKLCCLIFALTVFVSGITAFAADPKMIFTDVRYYTARIYVCDTQNTEAVILNVVPINKSVNYALTKDIEYRAIPINPDNIYGSKGQKLSLETINGYLLDSNVKVLIGKCGYGYRILYMEFLK